MTNKRLRFGVFEFDPLTNELRRDGVIVRLQSQPSQVLGALLGRAGQVVTRDSLRQLVWGNETHVDFESGLNFCIAQIRSALGDSAESPRYIKTVPKRGYEFIAPVVEIGDAAPLASVPAQIPFRRAMFPILAACVAGASGWYAWSLMQKSSGRSVRIAVARFENQTGDPALDRFVDGLADAVVAELTTTTSGRLAVIGNAAILRRARDRQDLARIADELKADFVVVGQVQRDSEKGRVLLHLIRLPDQAHLWVTRVDDPDFTDALQTQSRIARRAALDFFSKLPG